MAQESVYSNPEFRDMLQDLNQRYEDFFVHESEEQRWQRQFRVGAEEVKRERKQQIEVDESDRLEFIRNRKAEPSKTPLFRQWQSEQRMQAAEYEANRKQYVSTKGELNKIEQSARKIPEEKEYRLYIEEED